METGVCEIRNMNFCLKITLVESGRFCYNIGYDKTKTARSRYDKHNSCTGRTRQQFEKCKRQHPTGQARGADGAFRVGQIEPGLRYDLCRGAEAICRVAVVLRPDVFGSDGQAGRRFDRRPLPCHLHRPEDDEPQPALDRGYGDGNLRLSAPFMGAVRHAALPEVRQGDPPADHRPDRRPDHGAAGTDAVSDPVAGRPQQKGHAPEGL